MKDNATRAEAIHATDWTNHADAIGLVRLDADQNVVALAYERVDGLYAFAVSAAGRVVADGGYRVMGLAQSMADATLARVGYVGLEG